MLWVPGLRSSLPVWRDRRLAVNQETGIARAVRLEYWNPRILRAWEMAREAVSGSQPGGASGRFARHRARGVY